MRRLLISLLLLLEFTSCLVTQTDLLSPITLKSLRLTGDVRYRHFLVPESCARMTMSLSLSFDRLCKQMNISLILRPLSLPVVTPSEVPVPKGIVLPADFYRFGLNLDQDLLNTTILSTIPGKALDVSASKNNVTGLVEITIYSPPAGPWYLGSYGFGSIPAMSFVTLFPQIISEVTMDVDQLLPITVAPSGRTRQKIAHFNVSSPKSLHSKEGRSRVTVFANNSITNGLKFRRRRGDRVSDPRTQVVRQDTSTSISKIWTYYPDGKSNTQPFLSLKLSPFADRLLRLSVSADTTSVDLSLIDCATVSSLVPPSATSPPTSAANNCSVLIDGGRGVVPRQFSERLRPENNKTSVPNTTSVNMSQGDVLRFAALHTQEASYVHFYNPHAHWTVVVNISLLLNRACSQSKLPTTTTTPPQTPLGNKRFTSLQTDFPTKSNDTLSSTPVWAVSLLPWINSSWPRLVSSGNVVLQKLRDQMFVNPELPLHQTFEQCSIWVAPSRVSRMNAFAFHFTYQPRLGQHANGLRLSPWNAVNIPIKLEPNLDTGGSLEISLQLNAFDLTIPVNESHSQPLPRQVVLHACFSRHLHSSPFDFVNLDRCPLWLRLATSYGLAVSVAHAVSIAWTERMAIGKPAHRSERIPRFNTSYNDVQFDRSFMFLPYPTPGLWYLGLYAECYSTTSAFCSQDAAASIDVGLVIRSSPCLNYRCRDTGEGASLPPSRVMDPGQVKARPLDQSTPAQSLKFRWRPPWWQPINRRYPNTSVLYDNHTVDHEEDSMAVGEGYCVELVQQSIYASTCACPLGRAGLGCLRTVVEREGTQIQPNHILASTFWTGHSTDALLLAWSNLAFCPAIFLALVHRLWIPAIAYTYTAIFSAIYHLCDTDLSRQPIKYLLESSTSHTPSVSLHEFHFTNEIPQRIQLKSQMCALPIEALSFCDFFGGLFSTWVTIVAIMACPTYYAQLAHLFFILFLTVTLHLARHSAAVILAPTLTGVALLSISWILRTRRTKRLFPPVQWWILSFTPGSLIACTGVALFTSPYMKRYYTALHSLWHVLMGLSLLAFLPWPNRWRTALDPVIPRHVPLSCGGTRSSDPSSKVPMNGHVPTEAGDHDYVSRVRRLGPLCLSVIGAKASLRFYSAACQKIDDWIELKPFLDKLVTRWPKCQWLLPIGYRISLPDGSSTTVTTAKHVQQVDVSLGDLRHHTTSHSTIFIPPDESPIA